MKISLKNEGKIKTLQDTKAGKIHFLYHQLASNVRWKFFRQKYDTKWKLETTKKNEEFQKLWKWRQISRNSFFLFVMPLKDDCLKQI